MPTRRVPDEELRNKHLWYFCDDRDHKPDVAITREPGIYQHDCPRCGERTFFTIPEGMRQG